MVLLQRDRNGSLKSNIEDYVNILLLHGECDKIINGKNNITELPLNSIIYQNNIDKFHKKGYLKY